MNNMSKDLIVVGAGIAGLCAAAALASRFSQVLLLDLDECPPQSVTRKTVGQYQQLHCLLYGGLRALATLFPGVAAELEEAGAIPIDFGQDYRVEVGERPWIKVSSNLAGYSMTRALLERVLRRRVLSLPNVLVAPQHRVTGLVLDTASRAVLGVYTSNQVSRTRMNADLVIDASGRPVLGRDLINSLSLSVTESTIGVDISYSTAVFKGVQAADDWKAVLTSSLRHGGLTGMLSPVEQNQHQVTLVSADGSNSPSDEEGFRLKAARLRTQTIANALTNAELVSTISRFHFSNSTYLRWCEAVHKPSGYIPIGDALCRFNPVYGQGMSIAAMEAVTIQDLCKGNRFDTLFDQYLEKIGPVLTDAWSAAAFKDAPTSIPEHAHKVAERQAELIRSAGDNPLVAHRLLEVMHLVRPSSDLSAIELPGLTP